MVKYNIYSYYMSTQPTVPPSSVPPADPYVQQPSTVPAEPSEQSWTDKITGIFKSKPSTPAPASVGGKRRKSKRKQQRKKSRKYRKSYKK
jgi:hypothetical protein